MTAGDSGRSFRERVLDARTLALARRGLGADPGNGQLPPRLVCGTGDRLFALEPEAVAGVQPYRCHAMPLLVAAASGTMLGAFSHNGRIHSLLELAHLFGGADGNAAAAGGVMLLLRGEAPDAALRVDRVLGLLPLRPAGDARHGLVVDAGGNMPDDRDEGRRLALLIDTPVLRDAILSLDRAFSSDPAGA